MTTTVITKKRKRSKLGQRLRSQGFDDSYYDRSAGNWVLGCSQCVAVAINGLACHEHGCPNVRDE